MKQKEEQWLWHYDYDTFRQRQRFMMQELTQTSRVSTRTISASGIIWEEPSHLAPETSENSGECFQGTMFVSLGLHAWTIPNSTAHMQHISMCTYIYPHIIHYTQIYIYIHYRRACKNRENVKAGFHLKETKPLHRNNSTPASKRPWIWIDRSLAQNPLVQQTWSCYC